MSFAASLERSHRASDWPGWELVYREYFPTFQAMIDHRDDGEWQRAGIDRSIILRNTKQILVDEKVRGRSDKTGKIYADILVEVLSDAERSAPGWATKLIRADYIAYLIAPLGVCHLLPVIQLQSAWDRYGPIWADKYGERFAFNHGWTTVNVPVPVDVLYQAMGSCLHTKFEPFDLTDAPAELERPFMDESTDSPPEDLFR